MLSMRQPGLVVFDMDSTLISIECIDEIAALAGRKAEVSEVTEAAMRGDIDFRKSLIQRVAALEGVEETLFESLFEPIPLTHGATDLCAWLRSIGWRIALVSGGFTWFAEKVAAELQLDAAIANRLEIAEQRLTGRVIEPIIDAEAKASWLVKLARQWQIGPDQVIAVGDGANDIPMLKASSYGVAFCAKAAVRQHADTCIEQPDLGLLLDHLKALR